MSKVVHIVSGHSLQCYNVSLNINFEPGNLEKNVKHRHRNKIILMSYTMGLKLHIYRHLLIDNFTDIGVLMFKVDLKVYDFVIHLAKILKIFRLNLSN